MYRFIKQNWPLGLVIFMGVGVWFNIFMEVSSLPKKVEAASMQFGTNYLWTDSLVMTTAEVDSKFVTRWEQVILRPEGADLLIKAASPDTNLALRFFLLENKESISFGPGTPLKRLKWKTVSGTGILYLFGYKRKAQL